MRITFLLVAGCCLIFSCGRVDNANTGPYSFSLKDFRPKLRAEMRKIITNGYFGDETYQSEETLRKNASDAELLKMSKCEHPLIRAFALAATLERPKIDHYNVLMNHLDDTARIAWYAQCASNPSEYVSDYFINAFDKWKTIEEKQKTIHEVLTKHNYLMSAYTIVNKVQADPKYYEIVRKMAVRHMYMPDYLEYAWMALAQYKKPQDIQLLREIFDQHNYHLGYVAFRVMNEYPDTAYLPLLENYYKDRFYRDICERKGLEEIYLATLMAYKDPRSARLAERIITVDPGKFCAGFDTEDLQYQVYRHLEQNKCPSYGPVTARLKTMIAKRIKTEQSYEEINIDFTNDLPGFEGNPELRRW